MNITTTAFGNDTHEVLPGSYILGKYMKYSDYADVYVSSYTDEQSKAKLDDGKIPFVREGETLVAAQRQDISLEDFIDEVERWQSKSEGCRAYIALGIANFKGSTWRSGALTKHRYSQWKSERSSHSYVLYDITDMTAADLHRVISKFNDKIVAPQTKVYMENKMKKQYTKKQITEAIAYWKSYLNENKELKMWSYWLDVEEFYGGYQNHKYEYNPDTGKGGIAAYSKEDAERRIEQMLKQEGIKIGPGEKVQSIKVWDRPYALPPKIKTISLGDIGDIQVPMTIDFEDIKAAILDFVAKKFPLEK